MRDALRSVLAALACHGSARVRVTSRPAEGVVPLGTALFCVPGPDSLGVV